MGELNETFRFTLVSALKKLKWEDKMLLRYYDIAKDKV